jgi:hypothetical protein
MVAVELHQRWQQMSSDPLNNDAVNQAAYQFTKTLTTAKSRIANMSKKSLARVYSAVVEFPLSAKEPKFHSKFEHELFVLTLTALQCKNTMMDAVMKNEIDLTNKLKEANGSMGTEESKETARVSESLS